MPLTNTRPSYARDVPFRIKRSTVVIAKMRRGRVCLLLFFAAVSFVTWPHLASSAGDESSRTWRLLSELPEEALERIDLSADTPRDGQMPYLPAEPYPFLPPYTAEEMGYRAMEFPHMPHWNCSQIEDFASIMPSGYLFNGKTTVLVRHEQPEGLEGYLSAKPGEVYARWLSQDTAPPENLGNQMLMSHSRTDKQFSKKTDMFGYSPILRRVRRFPQPRRQDRFPDQPIAFDDFLGRDAWEFSWRVIGTDVLTETVRFPRTRTSITLQTGDGSFSDVATDSFQLMGEETAHYEPNGGVKCYVLEARAREDWVPDYYAPRILYWVDQQYFYPLRTEQYGPDGKLLAAEVRLATLLNPALKERGYHNIITVWWNVQLDFLAYAVHDGHRVQQWSEEDMNTFFHPDFMRRVWFPVPMKTLATVFTPEEFFLRPHLYREKFPQERQLLLPGSLVTLIDAQNAAGHLVFDKQTATAR